MIFVKFFFKIWLIPILKSQGIIWSTIRKTTDHIAESDWYDWQWSIRAFERNQEHSKVFRRSQEHSGAFGRSWEHSEAFRRSQWFAIVWLASLALQLCIKDTVIYPSWNLNSLASK